jgi:membrane protein YqaA with SNARE-associated domain
VSETLSTALSAVLAWFALPQVGLVTVFITAFVSATLLPMGSEPVVFGYVKLNPDQFWLTIAVATLGNTLAGCSITGWAAGHKRLPPRWVPWANTAASAIWVGLSAWARKS